MEVILKAKTLQIGSQTIVYYESKGKGPSVLLIHGNSLSGQCFQNQLDSRLGKEYRLIAIDLPGHGNSLPATNPELTYNLPGYAQIIKALVWHLSLTNSFFVGWSLGGHILLEAIDQLIDAAGFVIFGTPPLDMPPAMSETFISLPVDIYKTDFTESEIELIVSSYFKPNTTKVPDVFKTWINQSDDHARELLGISVAKGQFKDQINIVANLKKPLAILHGEQDQVVKLDYIKKLKTPFLWRNEIQIISDAGHSPHWEQPKRFNALLKAFIEETISDNN